VLWIAAILGGMVWLTRFQMHPGPRTPAPAALPSDIGRQESRLPTLCVFIHPKCPCSGSTIEELDRIVTKCGAKLSVEVFFVMPENQAAEWKEASLLRRAEAIRGAEVHIDIDGKSAKAFGAATSGETVLYDANGKLVFQGGITPSRAHEGDNPGRDTIQQYLMTGVAPRRQLPVYGCELGDLGSLGGRQ